MSGVNFRMLVQTRKSVLPVSLLSTICAASVVSAGIGALVVVSPLLAAALAFAAAAAVVGLVSIRASTVAAWALALTALIIAYPAFLPHPDANRVGSAIGGALDARAEAELAVVAAIACGAIWVFLAAGSSVRVFHLQPFPLLGIYAILISLSLLYTPDKAWATFAALKLFEAVLVLAVIASRLKSVDDITRLLNVMIGAACVVLTMYWLDVIVTARGIPSGDRLSTTWLHPNQATLLAATVTSVCVARWIAAHDNGFQSVNVATIAFGGLTTFMTSGKTAILALLAAVAVTVVVTGFHGKDRPQFGRITLGLLGSIFVVAAMFKADIGLAAHLQAYRADANISATSLTGRVPVWTIAIHQGLDRPVAGHGYMSTFAYGLNGGHYWVATQAHNSFIQTFFDLGVLGLLCVGGIYIAAWRTCAQNIATTTSRELGWTTSVQLLAALVVLSISSLTEDVLGGVFEIRTMLLLIVVLSIHQLRRLTLVRRRGDS
jgi:O-antigen ligase